MEHTPLLQNPLMAICINICLGGEQALACGTLQDC